MTDQGRTFHGVIITRADYNELRSATQHGVVWDVAVQCGAILLTERGIVLFRRFVPDEVAAEVMEFRSRPWKPSWSSADVPSSTHA